MPPQTWELLMQSATNPSLPPAAAVLAATAANREEKPLWEGRYRRRRLQLSGLPRFRQEQQLVPAGAYFTYHGDFFQADRHGIRAAFLDTDRIDFTVSAFLSPPSGSDIPARAGMPDLQATFRDRPRSTITLWRSENRARFSSCACRCVAFTLEGPPQDVGWCSIPT